MSFPRTLESQEDQPYVIPENETVLPFVFHNSVILFCYENMIKREFREMLLDCQLKKKKFLAIIIIG